MDSFDPRFSFAAWVRYEPTIAAWLDKYPEPFVFYPKQLALDTVMPRLRDAVKAKLFFAYPSTVVDHLKLEQAWPEVVVTRDRKKPGALRIGPREGRLVVSTGEFDQAKAPARHDVIAPTLDDLRCFMHLLNRGLITTEVYVSQCDTLTRQQLDHELPNYLNVGLVPNEDDPIGTFILL